MWEIQPKYATIIEILREKDSLSDIELFEIIKSFHKEISFREFNDELMKMEITGLITVTYLSKDKNLVELKKDPLK